MNPYGISKPTEIDQAELAIYNAGVTFSRLAYEMENRAPEGIDYARQIAASKRALRYQQRKKEQDR